MDEVEIKPGVTADTPDDSGEICLNIESDYYNPDVFVYLNKEQVKKLLSLFD